MRTCDESELRTAPRWSLWLVALICFGPLTALWLLGLLLVPLWILLIAVQLAQPEHFAHEWPETIWYTALPVAYVIAGSIGLVGLVRVLTLPHERPKRHRYITIGMVAVGLIGLLAFELPLFTGDPSDWTDGRTVAEALLLWVLPMTGLAWLLAHSWRYLLAGLVRPNVATRRSGPRCERLDA